MLAEIKCLEWDIKGLNVITNRTGEISLKCPVSDVMQGGTELFQQIISKKYRNFNSSFGYQVRGKTLMYEDALVSFSSPVKQLPGCKLNETMHYFI